MGGVPGGIRVVDSSQYLARPLLTMLLADQGAVASLGLGDRLDALFASGAIAERQPDGRPVPAQP